MLKPPLHKKQYPEFRLPIGGPDGSRFKHTPCILLHNFYNARFIFAAFLFLDIAFSISTAKNTIVEATPTPKNS